MNYASLATAFLCLAVITSRAQDDRRDRPNRPPGEERLDRPGAGGREQGQRRMRQQGPWNRDLVMARSTDGKRFEESKTFIERAGVPCLATDSRGRLVAVFQWFPFEKREAFDRIAMAVSEDAGKTWSEPRPIEFEGLPAEYERQFDPTLVSLEDGRFRLYFTSNPGRTRTAIYSAISRDATRFVFEPGERFGVPDEGVVDCSAAKLGETWHLFTPAPRQAGVAFHATSKDGLRFEKQADVTLPVEGSWIGNLLNTGGGLRFFGSGRGGVWSAQSADGVRWEMESGELAPGGDPAVAKIADGYLLVVTGGPRADSPMNPLWMRDAFATAGMPAPAGPQFIERNVMQNAGGAGASITANADYVYVFRDGVIYQFDARNLRPMGQVAVPESPRRENHRDSRRNPPREEP